MSRKKNTPKATSKKISKRPAKKTASKSKVRKNIVNTDLHTTISSFAINSPEVSQEFTNAILDFEKSSTTLLNILKSNLIDENLYRPFCEKHGYLSTQCMPKNAALLTALAHKSVCFEFTDAQPCVS
jgi:hypothetical protein